MAKPILAIPGSVGMVSNLTCPFVFSGLELTSLFYGEVEKAANVRFHGQQEHQELLQAANGAGKGGKLPVPVYNHKDPKEWLIKRSQYNSMKME